jgi:transposase
VASVAVTRRHDLTDAQWALLQSQLPTPKKPGRPPKWNKRQLVDGIRWRIRTGAPWRDVPDCYGHWRIVYGLYRRWQRDGTWARVLTALQRQADAHGLITWEVSVDSTIARAHQHAAGARPDGYRQKEPPGGIGGVEPDDHALGRSRGGWTTKLHLACEQGRKMLALVLTGGQHGDSPQLITVHPHVPVGAGGGVEPLVWPDRLHLLAEHVAAATYNAGVSLLLVMRFTPVSAPVTDRTAATHPVLRIPAAMRCALLSAHHLIGHFEQVEQWAHRAALVPRFGKPCLRLRRVTTGPSGVGPVRVGEWGRNGDRLVLADHLAVGKPNGVPAVVGYRLAAVRPDHVPGGQVLLRDIPGGGGIPFDQIHTAGGSVVPDSVGADPHVRLRPTGMEFRALIDDDPRVVADHRDIPAAATAGC